MFGAGKIAQTNEIEAIIGEQKTGSMSMERRADATLNMGHLGRVVAAGYRGVRSKLPASRFCCSRLCCSRFC